MQSFHQTRGRIVGLMGLVNSHHQTLIDIFIDDFVDFFPQFVGNFRLLGLHELAHHGHDVLAALRLRVGKVEIVQSHVLNHFLLLVDVT